MIIIGELINNENTKLEGWCWAPDRPSERRIVEIHINGRLATSAVAARMNVELRERAIGDGYHGFSVPMPPLPSGADQSVIIEARERQTGTIFGRTIIQDEIHRDHIRKKLSPAEDCVHDILRRLARHETAPKTPPLASALHTLGSSLISRSMATKRPTKPCEMTLPWIASPRVSFILPAFLQWRQTRDALRGLSSLLATYEAEIILADDGRDPETALVGARIRNLHYVFQPGAAVPRLDAAARVGRGRILCILSGLVPSVRLLLNVLGNLPTAPLILGHQPASLARELGYATAWPPSFFGAAATNLQAAVDRKLFVSTGGFDKRLSSPQLAFVDLALKSRLLGHMPMLWQECDRPHTLFSAGLIYQHRMELLERWPV